jgi:hypothetical protein
MSTSDKGGLVLGVDTTYSNYGNRPVRTSEWQSIANNFNHTADERSRVLVCWSPRSTTTGGYTIKVAGAWTRLMSFGPFPLLVGADGVPYPVRLAVGGRSTASSQLRIGVCVVGAADADMSATTAPANVLESVAFNNGTNLWRKDGFVTVDPVFQDYGIVNALSGATPSTVAAVLVTVEVWGKSATGSACIATQAYAAEQVAT